MAFKSVFICYLIIYSVSYLTADTAAYFNGQQQGSEIMITAGTWENEEPKESGELDNSSLAFIDGDTSIFQMCPNVIKVEIENSGDGPMLAEGSYEIYYVRNGHQEEEGIKLELDEGEGVIEVMEVVETKSLTYETNEPGVYIFAIYEHDDALREHPIWSEEITVICDSEETTEVENEESISAEEFPMNEAFGDEGPIVEKNEINSIELELENEYGEIDEKHQKNSTNSDDSENVEDVEMKDEESDEMAE